MKKTSSSHQLLTLLPYLAVISICAYVSTIAFQMGYYLPFGIDLFIINPRVDPTSLSTIGFVIIAAVVIAIQMSIIDKVEKSKKLAPFVILDMLAIIGVAILTAVFFFKLDEIEARFGHRTFNTSVAVFAPLSLVILYIVRAVQIRQLTLDDVSFQDAYIETSFFKPQNKSLNFNHNSQNVGRWVTGIIAAIIFVILLPGASGFKYASEKKSFTAIDTDRKESNLSVVVGSTVDGYIIKPYSVKEQKFINGWGIVKDGDLEFRTLQVKSVKEQLQAR